MMSGDDSDSRGRAPTKGIATFTRRAFLRLASLAALALAYWPGLQQRDKRRVRLKPFSREHLYRPHDLAG